VDTASVMLLPAPAAQQVDVLYSSSIYATISCCYY
jgi:hypothetical protein